jgi:hypothetical protein
MANNPTNQFSQLDFESTADFVTAFGNLRGRVQVIVQAITTNLPIPTLQFTAQAIEAVLQKRSADRTDHYIHPVHGTVTVQSQTYIYWEGMLFHTITNYY